MSVVPVVAVVPMVAPVPVMAVVHRWVAVAATEEGEPGQQAEEQEEPFEESIHGSWDTAPVQPGAGG